MNSLKIACLGGTGEIGMNLYLYETDVSAVIVDYGIMFADVDKHGIDYILPDISYLETIKDKLKAIIFTHGHEDHIGGVWYLLDRFNLPIYTGQFTEELLKHKLRDFSETFDINVISEGEEYLFGDIGVRFFQVNHSIPDTFGLYIKTPSLSCVHISDFRLDGSVKIPEADILLSDSTNVYKKTSSINEEDIKNELTELFENSSGNIFFTTFASNVSRLNMAIQAGLSCGRKIVIEGAAIKRTLASAARLGLVHIPEESLISITAASRDKEKCLYLVSGCQGETGGALFSIAMGERRAVKVQPGDLLVFSSRVIPGNEKNINTLVNSAMRFGAKVVEAGSGNIHVSGHADADSLAKVIHMVCPRYLIPIHGEFRHLYAHRLIAASIGMDANSVLFMEAGRQLIFNGEDFSGYDDIIHGKLYYDSRGDFLLGEQELSGRKQLSKDGGVLIRYESEHSVEADFLGFDIDSSPLLHEISARVFSEEVPLEEQLKKTVKKFFKKYYNRRPFIKVKIVGC